MSVTWILLFPVGDSVFLRVCSNPSDIHVPLETSQNRHVDDDDDKFTSTT